MKIVVIGGSGLIRAKLVARLREKGHEVLPASPKSGVNAVTGEGLARLTGAMADAVREEVRKIAGDKPIRYIINTQWGGEHTGGNVRLSEQGQRPAILAHENVGLRLAGAGAEASTLEMETYYGDNKMIYFNGEAIEVAA